MRQILMFCVVTVVAVFVYNKLRSPATSEAPLPDDISLYIAVCMNDDQRRGLATRARANRRSNVEQLRHECPACKCEGASANSPMPNIPDFDGILGRR